MFIVIFPFKKLLFELNHLMNIFSSKGGDQNPRFSINGMQARRDICGTIYDHILEYYKGNS